MTRVALIHATPAAVAPIAEAFARAWPEARTLNLLDDSLSPDLVARGRLEDGFLERFAALADYAERDMGADAILFTCSAFGPAIDAAARGRGLPVLKPNEAMFEAALAAGRRVGMLATLEQSIAPMAAEFREMAAARGADAALEPLCVEGAMDALLAGDGERHDALIAQAAPRLAHCDAVMLAHFSTARARAAVEAKLPGTPVLTSPDSAVTRLKAALAERPATSTGKR